MSYFLGIDGGGTKTTCAVGDELHVLATTVAGPSNIVRVGEARARESLQQAVRQACTAAGLHPDQITRTCVGGSGAARPELASQIRSFIAAIVSAPIDVVGDMTIALEAAFGDGPGVIVIAGTGSIAYGRDSHGRTARAGGWGFAIGDEGSAHWIGRETVRAILRASDKNEERVTSSPLTAALFKAWGVQSLPDLARAANSIPPPDFAALFPPVAASSDEIAKSILMHAGWELAKVATVVLGRLFQNEKSPVQVGLAGSVFRYAPEVGSAFYDELQQREPRVDVNLAVVEPVEGALRIARRAAIDGLRS